MGKLNVFVGHSDDASALASLVRGLKGRFCEELARVTTLDPEHPLQSVDLWEWQHDAEGRPGGQAELVEPRLREAHIGIFVFAERVGAVTRSELQVCLDRRIPTWGIFPARPPDGLDLAELGPLEQWRELVLFREALASGWSDAESRAVRPHARYRDAAHLCEILLEQFKRDVGAIVARSARPARRVVNAEKCLAAYRAGVRAAHDRLPALFQDPDQLRHVSTVFVELDVSAESAPRAELAGARDDTLQGLLARTGADGAALRWVVLGHPGAGKSTLARHLVWELAGQERVLPVYASLPSLVRERCHPFESAERQLVEDEGSQVGEGLAALLFERAEPGGVWLFLDGLDEVAPGADRTWVEARLAAWAASKPLARVPIAVFSRPVGFEQLPAYPGRARIRALDAKRQLDLLTLWLGDPARAAELHERICKSPALRDLCSAPLLLSLLALLVVEGGEAAHALPASRSALYERALGTLLERGHHSAQGGVRDPQAAYRVLAELCLELQESPGKDWSREELIERIDARRDSSDTGACARHVGRDRIWTHAGELLDDVARRSGVLGDPEPVNPRRRSEGRWSFLHRQFREFLAAEALREQGKDEAVLARARSLTPEAVPRWAESRRPKRSLSQTPRWRSRTRTPSSISSKGDR